MSDFLARASLGDPDAAPVIVLITWPSDRDAGPLARTLVEERLAACVSVSAEIRSHYRWEGAVQEDAERQLLVKTTAARVEALRARVAALHPYEVPEFLVVEVAQGGGAYLEWLRGAVAAP